MIKGIGTDIVEVERIERSLSNQGFIEKVFTQDEIIYCEKRVNKAQHYGARFAAKEAFFKALGTGMRNGMSFAEIEVINDELGKPTLRLYGKVKEVSQQMGITQVMVSISHVKSMAMAMVVVI